MSLRGWRVLGTALIGLAVAIFLGEWYEWGALGMLGVTALILLTVGFALNVYSLVRGK